MMKRLLKLTLSIGFVTGVMVSNQAYSAAIVCAGYKPSPTNVPSQRTGKKVQQAYEAYNNDQIQESINILSEIKTSDSFDKAFVDRFLGNLLAAQEGQGKKALGYLKGSVKDKELNDSEHAGALKLIADLSMQEKQYSNAINYYGQWMKFTCKQDADVYTRIAQAYYELKQLDKIIAPANKAISLYEKPNKNPYVLKLTSYYERKMYPQTVKVAEALVKQFPDNKQWWTQLGFFYMLVEDYKRALSTMEVAYREGFLTKKSEIKALSQLYGTNEIPYKAAQILEKYIKSGLLEKNETNYAALANAFHQAKHHKKAARYYGQAGKIKNNPEHYRKQGVLLLAAEDYKGALGALKMALDNGADEVGRIHIAMMEANFYQGNFRQAYTHAKEAKKDRSTARNARAWEPYIKEKAKNRGLRI